MSRLVNLKQDGFVVLPNVFNHEQIAFARKTVLDNIHLLKNTRPTVSSRHLAGFHRHPALEILHCMLVTNSEIRSFINDALGGMDSVTIGLSDITINRSQEWHCDLLRGAFSSYLNEEVCWGPRGGGVYKALLYLQEGKSLATVPGSHARKTSLDNDQCVIPKDLDSISHVSVNPGDVVIIDLRLIHRGSTEAEMQSLTLADNAKILISTVFGGADCPLTNAMEVGNFHRLMAWIAKYP
jgi:hypothetical protein